LLIKYCDVMSVQEVSDWLDKTIKI